jgi:hypothetical protein
VDAEEAEDEEEEEGKEEAWGRSGGEMMAVVEAARLPWPGAAAGDDFPELAPP